MAIWQKNAKNVFLMPGVALELWRITVVKAVMKGRHINNHFFPIGNKGMGTGRLRLITVLSASSGLLAAGA